MLVTESTTEAFNILLPLLGAIVTDSGGLLVPFGDHRPRIRDSGRCRHAQRDPAHRRRCAGARRRRRRQGDGARVKQVVPLEKALDKKLFGSKAVGLGQAVRDGVPVPPGIALCGAIVEAVAAGEERAIRRSTSGAAAWRTPGGALFRRRRGWRAGKLRRAAPDAAQRPLGGRARRRTEARSGGRRIRIRRLPTASASACSTARASGSSSRGCSTPTPPESCSPRIRSPGTTSG